MQVFTFDPHLIHLFVTTFLNLFLKVFNLQGKDASKSAGNLMCAHGRDKLTFTGNNVLDIVLMRLELIQGAAPADMKPGTQSNMALHFYQVLL
jgi:hypothetical protein